MDKYKQAAKSLDTLVDFLRFGVSCAHRVGLYYGHGTDNVWDDLMALVLGSLSLPYDVDFNLIAQARLTLAEKEHLALQLFKRIEERVPVPYLTHEAMFCDLLFYVDERVLIPRSPFAELIKQHFLPWVADDERVTRILDLCTGSGCIAIACCEAFPEALVDAVDISADALAVASINRARYGLEQRLRLIESDLFTVLPTARYDVIVSNPPYVGVQEMQSLPKEYSHEPRGALEAAHDGLAIIEAILVAAGDYLTDHGVLIVEVGNSEHAVMQAYPQVPFTWLYFENGGQGVFLLTAAQVKTYFSV